MLKTTLSAWLLLLMITSNSSALLLNEFMQNGPVNNTGTMEKMIVASGSVAMDVNLARLNGTRSAAKDQKSTTLRFDAEHDAFFKVLVFNDELRGALPGSMGLLPQNSASLPSKLAASYQNLVIEKTAWGEQFELVVRDGKTGFVFFNVEGHEFTYDASQHSLALQNGRLLISEEFAQALGRPSDAAAVVGQISFTADMRPIEITQVVNDEVKSDMLPSVTEAGTVPGPDVIVGDLNGLTQPDAAAGTRVGISVGTDSCNLGAQDLDWFALPDNDHPVIPQNMYRMSGGATNDERFEQIGQSSVKHAFTALTENICTLGCNGTGGTHLGSGCSDPYVASLNSGGSGHTLGSRAWINPFTGAFPRSDSATPPNSHTGHTHDGTSHRILVEISDLSTTSNPGASYYAEAQYITPHEYVWCQAHAGQCNMYNNVSYRRYNVTGTGSPFSFQTGGFTTQRSKTAISAWTGSTSTIIEPAPGQDGIGTVAYKVTNPSPGVWHYEYAVYNQNMDRGIQSFSVPIGSGITLTNVGFHAPPQQPGWAGDGTVGNAGFSSTPWTSTLASGAQTWATETFAQNANANVIRWGTMYNFRFDSNRPPQAMNATLGFYKTGAPMTVAVQGPAPAVAASVTVSGRVTSSNGQGIGNAIVSLVDSGNSGRRYTITSSFGYYSFDNVAAGTTYTITPVSKRYTFTPQTLLISGDTNVDFTGAPQRPHENE
jgi:Carboxypeptidase regulatory-like domain